MDTFTPETISNVDAANLIYIMTKGKWRVLPEILGETQSLRFQSETGLNVQWDPKEERFQTWMDYALRDEWAERTAERAEG